MISLRLPQQVRAPDMGGGSASALTLLALGGSVGANGRNRPEDVRVVKERLRSLGFGGFDDGVRADQGLIGAIRLFQSIAQGQQRVVGDGRIDLQGATQKWLEAANAPRWQKQPLGNRNGGFYNYEVGDQPGDAHDFGTNWLASTLVGAGDAYLARYRSQNPRACPILVNDASLPHGHDTNQHAGHETGMSVDLRIPNTDGDQGRGVTWQARDYDRTAMRAMLRAFREQDLTQRIFFNDPTLIREGLCVRASGHDNHAHVEIHAPAREA